MFAAIKNSKSTVELLMNAKADATLHNYVRLFARAILLILTIQVRRVLVLYLMPLERVLRASQKGNTARQVARAKSYHSVEKILPKDPNQKGCVLLWVGITLAHFYLPWSSTSLSSKAISFTTRSSCESSSWTSIIIWQFKRSIIAFSDFFYCCSGLDAVNIIRYVFKFWIVLFRQIIGSLHQWNYSNICVLKLRSRTYHCFIDMHK